MNHKSSIFFYLFISSFLIGVFLSSLFFLPYKVFIYALVTLMIILIFIFFSHNFFFRTIAKLGTLIFMLFLGFFYAQYYTQNKVGELEKYVGSKISLSGVIVDEPDVRDFNTKLTFKPDTVKESKIILKTTPYPEYEYGDKVIVSGVLIKPENFEAENGREFDYVNFLKKDNIFYVINWSEIEKTGEGGGNVIKRSLFKIKKKFLDQSKKLLPEPHSSFLGGLILGAKGSMGQELQDDFRKTGVIHIVVLSGFNVTIVADFIVKFFSFLGFVWSGLFGGISIVLFAIMTGASATIVRASIMALLVIIAKLTNRYSEITRALFLAGFFMVLFNPMLLVYDPSFQLSFLASLGLIKLSPHIESRCMFIPKGRFDLRGLFAATVSTQIFVFPFLIWMMGEFSIVSPAVNMIVLAVVPSIMLIGFLMNIISFVYFPLGLALSVPVFLMLDYILISVGLFSKIPGASVSIPSYPFYIVLVTYLMYTLIAIRFSRSED